MIEISIKIDSTENKENGVTFGCNWKILTDEISKNEEFAAKFILQHVQQSFDELSTNALVNGGSVEHLK